MSDLLQRLSSVLADAVTIVEESAGALTVAHDGTVASLRVVNIGEGLELISLTQPLAWDIKLDNKLRDRVADHAGRTMLGSVVLVERAGDPREQSGQPGTFDPHRGSPEVPENEDPVQKDVEQNGRYEEPKRDPRPRKRLGETL